MGGTIIELESERFIRVESERLIRIGKEEGKAEGKEEDILLLLLPHGEIPDTLKTRIKSQKDPNTLNQWLLYAAKSTSISDFTERIDQQ